MSNEKPEKTNENGGTRDKSGRWLPGHVPNPKGRPRVAHEVRLLAQQHCPAAIAKIAELMVGAEDQRVQLAAAEAILDRGVGRPIQAVEVTHEDRRVPQLLEQYAASEDGMRLLALAESIANATKTDEAKS